MIKAALAWGEEAAQQELRLLLDDRGEQVRELGAITQVCWRIREEAAMNKRKMMTASLTSGSA